MKLTKKYLKQLIREVLNEGKPYKGSRQGKTESQVQQKAAGMAHGCRKKRGAERKKCANKLKEYGGAAWNLYSGEITNDELRKLATIRAGAEIPKSDAKPGEKRKALPKRITDSKNKKKSALKEKQSWYEEDVSPDQLGDEELLSLFNALTQATKGPDKQPKIPSWRDPGGGKFSFFNTFMQKKINNERVINKRRLKQLRKELRIRFGDRKWDNITKKYLNFRKISP
jgi:hypothetical protein